MTSPLVAEIKRLAVHDGPGIRTTVFLKGCPLRCLWCHNPECLDSGFTLLYRRNRCRHCGDCVPVCPHGAHALRNGQHDFDRTRCWGCGACVDACLHDALEGCGQCMTVDGVVAAMMEDAVFYRESGGGVTLSGGEPLLWPVYCAEVFAKLKNNDIHTAIDTCGDVPWEAFETVFPMTDIFLYDFKHADSDKHRELIGRDNGRIKENLLRLGKTGKSVEIRMPLIPGLNMDDSSLDRAAEFWAGVSGSPWVRLLPYHALARAKYEAAGRSDSLPSIAAPTAGEMDRAVERLRARGVRVHPPALGVPG